MKAIAVIGYHHTGKTTTVVALVQALTAKGYKVATIKDIHSESFRADVMGKNSALHIEAGSSQTFARGLYDSSLIFPKQLSLQEMIAHLEADFLIIEGMKTAAVPKIVCAERTEQLDELMDGTTFAISGMIADTITEYKGKQVFCLQKDLDTLVDLVLKISFPILPMPELECCSRCGLGCYEMAAAILAGTKNRHECVMDSAPTLSLKVGGQEIAIVPFVQDVLKDTILAIVKNLKGIDLEKEINITIKNP